MKSFALWSLLAGVALSAGAAEMKKVLIFNFPGDPLRQTMAAQAIKGLENAGFINHQNIEVIVKQQSSSEDGFEQAPRRVVGAGRRGRPGPGGEGGGGVCRPLRCERGTRAVR